MLLYAFQEDLAEFILKYINKSDDFAEWKKQKQTESLLRKKRVESNAGKVGLFLKETQPQLNFTRLVLKLVKDDCWCKAIRYRNSWVHEKPPIIEGFGIQHNRESRIEIEEKKRSFGFGGNSKPDYTIKELIEICNKAIDIGVKTINDIIAIVDQDEESIKNNIRVS